MTTDVRPTATAAIPAVAVVRVVGVAVVLAAVVVGLLAGTAGPAAAHAAVRSTSPFDGERLAADEVPTQVTIEFNEDVTVPPDAVRVFDADGDRVDVDGPVEADDPTVVARALGELEDGGHVVTWAVVSADGHPLRGAFVFTVGEGPAASDEVVAAVFGGGDGWIGAAQVVLAWTTYVAVLLAAGALVTTALLRRRDDVAVVPAWLRPATLVGIAATVLVVPLQAAAVSGDGLAAAVDPRQLAAVLAGSVGAAALVRLAGLVVVLVARGPVRLAGAVVALGSFLVDGHTRTVEPLWLMLGADALHLAAAAVWLGGLALLAHHLRAHRLADDPVGGARLVADWSRVATVAVAGVLVAGLALSWATVRTPDALTTTYGTTLAVKVALAGLVMLVGLYNNRRVVPAVQRAVAPVPVGGAVGEVAADEVGEVAADEVGEVAARPRVVARTEAGWRRLDTTVRLEVALIVVVLAVTGWLQGQRPAAEELGIGGTFIASEQLTESTTLDVVVDPNVAGRNTIHLYLLDETGRTVQDVEGVTLLLSLPERDIGPIERTTQVAGPGHWTVVGDELAVPGTWEIEVVVRLDPFTEESVTVRSVVGAP